jgi:ribonuclease HI
VTIALEHDGNNIEAELLAMREAVRLAGELDEFEHVKNVIIFSDCQAAFLHLKKGYYGEKHKGFARIRSDIIHRVKKLANDDISVEFNWISERALITPHVAVDKLSKVYRHHIMRHWPAESSECELEPFMIDPARLESAEDLVPFLGRHLYVNGRLAEF